MRKISLLSFFVVIISVANAQWTRVNIPHRPDATSIFNVEVPNATAVWASASILSNGSFLNSNKYFRTTDAGVTWQYSTIQSPADYVTSNIYPIDSDTCYASMYNSSAGLGGGIFKTTNGGTTWTQLGKGKIFNASSFPDFVHFWSASDGMALGDGNGPGDPYMEIYTTTDYGTTWTRVPRENLPVTNATPFSIVNSYCVYGDKIWCQIIEGDPTAGPQFIYRSDDKGLHWKSFPIFPPTSQDFGIDISFIDDLNGFIVGKDDFGTPYLMRSSDGGENWDLVNYSGILLGGSIANVPGTSSLITTNAYAGPNGTASPLGSAVSFDLGNTWTERNIDLLAHADVKFLNANVGWSGEAVNKTNNTGGMFQWTGNILPVTFSSFTATKATQSVVLNWQTAQESNNAYFAVERSVNGTDFTQIGKVTSKGTSTQPQQYGYEDFGFAKGQNYYRLKQVNTDGKFAYSAVVSVEFTGTQIVRMYPNPVKNVLHVDGLSNTAVTTISIVNNAGTVVQKITTTGSTYTFNLQLLPAGNYYLKLENNKKVTTMKFIKQ